MQNQPDATLARMEKDGTGGMGEHLQERSHIVVTRDRRSQIKLFVTRVWAICVSCYGCSIWRPKMAWPTALPTGLLQRRVHFESRRTANIHLDAGIAWDAGKERGWNFCAPTTVPGQRHLHLRSGCATQATDMPQNGSFVPIHENFFFCCIAERAIKPCRSSRSKLRGEFGIPRHLQNRNQKHNKATNKQNTKQTKDKNRQVLECETRGEKRVKRPKRPNALICRTPGGSMRYP